MAWFKTGGGALSETVLWTNQSPTSSYSATSITLSDSIENYTYIGLYCRYSTSDANELFSMIPSSQLINGVSGKSQYLAVQALIGTGSGSTVSRGVTKQSGTTDYTKVMIGSCITVTTGTGTTKNGNLVPIKIVGLK